MRRPVKAAVVIAVAALSLLCAWPSRAADPLARYDDHGTRGLSRVPGQTYLNNNYGFSVRVPAGETGLMNKPPNPNHGIAVYLGHRRSIVVDASFDSALLGSTGAVADEAAGFVPGGQMAKCADTLGNRPAERIVQSWPAAGRQRIVVARWDDAEGAEDAINFTLTLVTTAEAYAQDKRTFDGVVNSFRFVKRKP